MSTNIHIHNFGQLSLSIHKPPLYKLFLRNDIEATNKIEEIDDYKIERRYGNIYLAIDDIRVQVATYDNVHVFRTIDGNFYYAISKEALIDKISHRLVDEKKELQEKAKKLRNRIKTISNTLNKIIE